MVREVFLTREWLQRDFNRVKTGIREHVLQFFRGAERYNCAQAILKGFQEKFSVPQEKIDEFKAYGGGRSEGGFCGALFAAKSLLGDNPEIKELEKRFAEETGGTRCRELRKLNKVSCAGCVGAAAELLHEITERRDF